MRAIGFRAEPAAVNWAVVEGSKDAPILLACEREVPPKTFDEVASLSWFRGRVQYIVQTYSPSIAAVRYPESFQPHVKALPLGQRCRIEGVLIEAVHASGLNTVLTGPLATIAKNLGRIDI